MAAAATAAGAVETVLAVVIVVVPPARQELRVPPARQELRGPLVPPGLATVAVEIAAAVEIVRVPAIAQALVTAPAPVMRHRRRRQRPAATSTSAAATGATDAATAAPGNAADAPGNTADNAPSNDNTNDNTTDQTTVTVDPTTQNNVTISIAPTTQNNVTSEVTPELAAIMSIPTTDPRGGEDLPIPEESAAFGPGLAAPGSGVTTVPPGGLTPAQPVNAVIRAVIVTAAQSPWDAIQRAPGVGTVTVIGGIIALGKTPLPGEIPGGGPEPAWLRVIPDLDLLNGSKIPPVVPNIIDIRWMNFPMKVEEKNP